ncbi:sacsin N-terminal ATP-binding-like domain-containing protein [Bizionia paragorgiae]|uniref:sacsin N-terminal ATP-binding-like domain-containing protein n=1 Tax=Bizionia paragorgiae TaxID=283786 RepID=UPI003A8CCF40
MKSQITRASQFDKYTQKNDLKGHADRIIQGIKKIGPNHAKRAIWELFQNAVDLSEHCEISINIKDNELIFAHNGVPFTMHTLDCLFTQVSSKTLTNKKLEREESDPIGQYGTGFMTSHSFGDLVKVSGAIKDEFEEDITESSLEGHIKFEDLVIDRSTQDWEKLCDEIINLRKQVKRLLNQPLIDGVLPATIFKFEFNNELNKQRSFAAIESLKTILPYVMIFNDRLERVKITDNLGNITTYLKDHTEESAEHYYSRIIRINGEVKKINYLKTDRLTIALPFTNVINEDVSYVKAFALSDSLPKLFLFYPLIGTENFGFNFVIHSKNFQPTEPRDGLHLNSENEKNKIEEEANQKLIEEASQLIFDFLENHLSKIIQPHFLAEINFAISIDNQELSDYFKKLKEIWTAKFRTLPFVETHSATIAPQDAVFLDLSVIDGAEPETLKAIYNISGKFFPNLPKPDVIPIWTKLTDEWNEPEIDRIGFFDIAEKIQESGTIEFFDKEELILFYKEMIRKGEGELFANKALLPNIKGEFRKQVELSKSVELTEELIEIADVLNPKISNRQIEPDFILEGLEFERFGRKDYMGLINAALDENIKEGTCSNELPNNYLASLMQYASIVTKEDSLSGPIRVIKLIAEHYKLTFTQLVLPTLPGDDNIDVRKGQFDFFKIYLNDISTKDKEWVETNIDALAKILSEAFSSADIKKFFLRYDVYPNQLYQLKPIISLHKDNQIPDFIKSLYDKIVGPSEPVKSKLAHSVIKNLYDEMKSTSCSDLTRQIEQKFFGESGNEIHMENHPFKSDIIDIIRNFKQDQWGIYEKNFPATHRNRSAILVQLADGEASFTILSQSEDVIKKLAGIADHPNLEELLKLGEDALRKKRQDEAEMQYKKKIGNHLEDVLRKHLDVNINATIASEQDGQDLVVYIEDKAVYYIEVKSKWLETTPIRISRNQTLRAYQNQNCFALCSIDMTKYTGADKYNIESINGIVEFMKFNLDVGSKVGHLIDIYSNSHQEDKFSLDGDYRTLIPAKYIQEGIELSGFEKSLIESISKKHIETTSSLN